MELEMASDKRKSAKEKLKEIQFALKITYRIAKKEIWIVAALDIKVRMNFESDF